jgi:hypothetical protein
MKKLLPLIAFGLMCSVVMAQVKWNRCGTYELMQAKEQQNPGYMARANACFDNAKRIADAAKGNRSANDTIYHIQLVFHILYMAPEENIPDSVIYSQIAVLNEDYRRLNADTALTRDCFKPVAGDARMDFHLATVDPNGNPTNGITRTAGTPQFGFYSFGSDNMKVGSLGGKDPWPTDRYVNVWVCNLSFGIGVLGYSFPPDNAPNWPAGSTADSAKQGVVLHYPVVGRNFSAPIDPTVAGGKSLTHELGHYFGLRHIWGDGDCSVDDGLDDTPNADAAHQQTCDTTVNTCVDSPVDFPDMIENYMDYSDDRCLNMFTHEQIGIMRAMLQTSRAGVATVEIISGIKNIADNFESIQLYPNPAKGIINLDVKTKNTSTYNYEIRNALGEKVEAASATSGAYQVIDLSAQPSGVYFAKIFSEGQTVVRKFTLVN